MEVKEEFSAPVVEAAMSAGNACSSSAYDDAPQEESDVVRLWREIELLKVELADCKEKLIEIEKEKEVLLEHQFSLDKIKFDDSAILFYTGFPNYRSLVGFYNFIEPKLQKMQYWKGEKLLKESQPYQTEDNRQKPGPSRKLTYLDELLLVLMRLKAGIFVQDLADLASARAWCQEFALHGWNSKTSSHFQRKN